MQAQRVSGFTATTVNDTTHTLTVVDTTLDGSIIRTQTRTLTFRDSADLALYVQAEKNTLFSRATSLAAQARRDSISAGRIRTIEEGWDGALNRAFVLPVSMQPVPNPAPPPATQQMQSGTTTTTKPKPRRTRRTQKKQ